MRRGMQGLALQVQESLKRDPHAGDLYIFRGRRGDLAKILWHDGNGAIALCQTIGPRKVHMAIGVRRRGVDLGGADGVYARGDRLAKSATDVAAQERRLACAIGSKKIATACILGRLKSRDLLIKSRDLRRPKIGAVGDFFRPNRACLTPRSWSATSVAQVFSPVDPLKHIRSLRRRD